MDVYFDMKSGEFVLDPDEEDIAKTNRDRFVVLNRSARDLWPILPGHIVKDGSTFNGQPYTHLISVDDTEGHVTSTLPPEATQKVLLAVATQALADSKGEEHREDEAANRFTEETDDFVIEPRLDDYSSYPDEDPDV